MGGRIHFDESWFRDEEIDGFLVKSMMKRYWAAALEILVRIDELCDELGVQYFADWGTLLGAVRHGGFIPWDDDLDITMLREDYQIFSAAARDGRLADGLILKEYERDPEYANLINRVVNGLELSTDERRLEIYHGCPYIVGVDIFVLDDAAPDLEHEKVNIENMQEALKAVDTLQRAEYGECDEVEVLETVKRLEVRFGIRFEKNRSYKMQVRELINRLSRKYEGSESEFVNYPALRLTSKLYIHQYEKSMFTTLVRLPFGPITIPVPLRYHLYLTSLYGDDYIIPVRDVAGHDYPLYKDQEEVLRQELIKRKLSGCQFGIDTSY